MPSRSSQFLPSCLRSCASAGLVVSLATLGCGSDSSPAQTDKLPVMEPVADSAVPDVPPTQPGRPGVQGGNQDAGLAAGPDAASAPVSPPVAKEEFCSRLLTVLCKAEATCCTDTAQRSASEADCMAAKLPDCRTQIESATLDPVTGYDANLGGQALANLASRASSCDPEVGSWFVSRSGFLGVFRGSLPSGSAQCVPTSASNLNPLLGCENGSVCRFSSDTKGNCGAIADLGTECRMELECVDGLHCGSPSLFAPKKCIERMEVGHDCTSAGECDSLLCLNKKCVAATANSTYCFKTGS